MLCPVPSELDDCVVIMMESGSGRDPALAGSGSSALECGHLEWSVIELAANEVFSGISSPVAD
jgi:hypothetical protein